MTLPSGAELVELFAGTSPPADDIAATACRLHQINAYQWAAEDNARRARAEDEVAAAKRRIDELNLARHECIELLDELVQARLDQNPTAPLHTETPGAVIDRLSVLMLRIHHTEASAYVARVPLLHQQLADQIAGFDHLAEELARGSRRFALYKALKLYDDHD